VNASLARNDNDAYCIIQRLSHGVSLRNSRIECATNEIENEHLIR